jgi:hypothetical protein
MKQLSTTQLVLFLAQTECGAFSKRAVCLLRPHR